jgi:glycosyltransferase involved in cell wall biosynthesis
MSPNKFGIAIWGHGPPPYGGMTVHISRLIPKLRDARISYQLYNFSSKYKGDESVINYSGLFLIFWFLRLYFWKTPHVHYVLTVRSSIRFLATLAGVIRKKKVIIRIGGASIYKGLYKGALIDHFFTQFAVKHAAAIIGVNKDICQLAISLGANPKYVRHIPGFIPPSTDGASIPEYVRKFYLDKAPKLLITGRIADYNQKDIYGIRNMLDVMEPLLKDFPEAGLLIVAQNNDIKDRYSIERLRKEIKNRAFDSRIMIYHGNVELWPIMTICDIFLRPSISDGDANSIREALFLGIPVVASDSVERPEPVVTFKTGDSVSLYRKIKVISNDMGYYKSKFKSAEVSDNSIAIVSLIKELLNSSKS